LGHALLCVSFNAERLLIWFQEGHPARKRLMPLICKGSVPKQVEEETQGNQLAQVHVKKGR